MSEQRSWPTLEGEVAQIATPDVAGAFVLESLHVCDGRGSETIVLIRTLHALSMRPGWLLR